MKLDTYYLLQLNKTVQKHNYAVYVYSILYTPGQRTVLKLAWWIASSHFLEFCFGIIETSGRVIFVKH